MTQRKILYADEGKWLTDGNVIATQVYLAQGEDEAKWREITDEQRQTIEAEQIKEVLP